MSDRNVCVASGFPPLSRAYQMEWVCSRLMSHLFSTDFHIVTKISKLCFLGYAVPLLNKRNMHSTKGTYCAFGIIGVTVVSDLDSLSSVSCGLLPLTASWSFSKARSWSFCLGTIAASKVAVSLLSPLRHNDSGRSCHLMDLYYGAARTSKSAVCFWRGCLATDNEFSPIRLPFRIDSVNIIKINS